MSAVDDAIKRAEDMRLWNRTPGGRDSAQAYLDREVLAAEVKRLREIEQKVAETATRMQAIFDDYWASR